MKKIILHIGSNKDNRIALLTRARLLLSVALGTIHKASPIYETAAWGMTEQADFLNQALLIVSTMESPSEILHTCQRIENQLGRTRSQHWGPRRIDIDLIFIDHLKIDTPKLTIPHPYYKERQFVLCPLADIIPDYIPVDSTLKILELKSNCSDDTTVKMYLNSFSS